MKISKMSKNEKIVTSGAIGEKIVQQELGGVLSPNKFDPNKDLTLADGTEVEIKTQVKNHYKNVFSIPNKANQKRKSQAVDRLVIVEYGSNDVIKLWDIIDRSYIEYTTSKGIDMIGFSADNAVLITTLTKPRETKVLQALNTGDQYYARPL